MAEMEKKKQQLLAANKAAARILLLGAFSEGSGGVKKIIHNYVKPTE